MKPRVIIVHGIHTNDNAGWMRYLEWRFLQNGWRTYVHTYGYARAILTRWQNPGRAEALADLIEPGDVVLGHSNGGCLAWMAAELGAPMAGAILLNPALDRDKLMAPQVQWVNLYTNRFDEAVPWAEMLFRGSHPWGTQGRDGISVPDVPRYRVVETSIPRVDAPAVRGHSAILATDALPAWSNVIVRQAEARR